MIHPPSGIIDALKEPDLLDSLHTIAERNSDIYVVHHALIKQLTRRAFGMSGECYASLGVEVQEVVNDFSGLETPPLTVSEKSTALTLVGDMGERIADTILDVTDGFRQVEPDMVDMVSDVVAAHVADPSSRSLALFGAALSYSMQLGHTMRDVMDT